MADRTYQSFYKNEIRALELTIEDQDGNDFVVDEAYTIVFDQDDNVIVDKQIAMVEGEEVRTLIGRVVTSATGMYNVDWELISIPPSGTHAGPASASDHVYYHRTELEVVDL